MFKKLKKKRLSLKLKRKSTSLKDINVVGNFVLQTAQIMSASAESLETLQNSISLLSILEKAFHRTNKSSTAQTSVVSSSNRNSIFNRSGSTNNSSPRREMSINNNNVTNIDKDIWSTTEESTNCLESISIETKEAFSYCRSENELLTSHFQDSVEDNDEASEDIGAITEENGSCSEIVTSYYIDPIENSFHTPHILPPKREISKHHLKRSFSFSDIDIREIKVLNKIPETIRTFSSTESTLSLEIIRTPDSGTIDTIRNIHVKHILTNRERYIKKAAIKYFIKTEWCSDKSKSLRKIKFRTLISYDKKKYSNRFIGSIPLNIIENVKMLSYAVLKDYYHSFFKLNVVSDEIYNPIYATSTLEDLETSETLYSGDRREGSVSNNNETEKSKLQMRASYHGDERSEISEINPVDGKGTDDDTEDEVNPSETTQPSIVARILTSRTITATLIIGAVLLLTPVGHSLFRWLSTATKGSADSGPVPTLHLDTGTHNDTLPAFYVSSSLFRDRGMARIIHTYQRL